MSILSMIGLGGVPAWVVEGVAILALLGTSILYFEHKGATHELAKLQVSSTELIKQANDHIADLTKTHVADVAANMERRNADLKLVGILSDDLDQRVRDFDAYRRKHPDVARAPGGQQPAGGGECGNRPCSDIIVQLAGRGDELARSNGELAATLQSCQRERDSLVGKP